MNFKDYLPQGKTCAAIISVIFDDGADAIAKAPDLQERVKSRSVWEYGATRGVERICRSLERAGTQASWFVPGAVAARQPGLIRDIAGAGHDIECHGWQFERHDSLPQAESSDLLERARDTLAALTSRAPRGFRLPAGNWPRHFDRQLAAAGFGWSASLDGDDVPYPHASGLIEIPTHLELEDRPYFQFNFTPAFPTGHSRIPDYEGVLHNWLAAFEAARRYGLCFMLQVRPEWTGTPGRIGLLDQLLDHIRGCGDAWLTTADTLASGASAAGLTLPKTHPLHVYEAYLEEPRLG